MKTIGLIGGISWVSTADYYKYLNEGINERLGGMEFARCIIHSLNYGDIRRNNENNDWDKTLTMLTEAAQQLETAGAEALLLCANTMHKMAPQVQAAINIPVLHIATATGRVITAYGLKTVGLLGTKFTMEEDFYKDKLKEQNISCLIPSDDDRAFIHATIGDELGKGIIKPETKSRYIDIIQKLVAEGAEGIILGCTEIPLLIKPEDVNIPTFDTTYIHATEAVKFSLDM